MSFFEEDCGGVSFLLAFFKTLAYSQLLCFQRGTHSALYCSLPQPFQVMDSLTFLQGKKKKNHTVLYNIIILCDIEW